MPSENSKRVMDAKGLNQTLEALAKELAASEKRSGPYLLMGIQTRGVPLARRLAALLPSRPHDIGILDINLYRDDLSTVSDMPIVRQTIIPCAIDGARILLVDDVLFTGRTVRSAMDALMDLGRPKRIELLSLIDRGGRELPIQADFCGKTCDVRTDEVVKVRLMETDNVDEVVIAKLETGAGTRPAPTKP